MSQILQVVASVLPLQRLGRMAAERVEGSFVDAAVVEVRERGRHEAGLQEVAASWVGVLAAGYQSRGDVRVRREDSGRKSGVCFQRGVQGACSVAWVENVEGLGRLTGSTGLSRLTGEEEGDKESPDVGLEDGVVCQPFMRVGSRVPIKPVFFRGIS